MNCAKLSGIKQKICSFYSPPEKQRNLALIDHLTSTLQFLINVHPNAGIFLCGDRNNVVIQSLLSVEPSLQQIVPKPTHGRKILDVICTNILG